jgi:hypothetical protein
VLLFHLLAAGALVGVGHKHYGDIRLGLMLALAYALLPQTVDKIAHGSRLMPGAWAILALWAWPQPVLSGLCLGLATAQWWFPVVLLPMWLTSFRGRRRRLMFAVTVLLIGAALASIALRPTPERSVADQWRAVRDSVLASQGRVKEGIRFYSTDGFWLHVTEEAPAARWVRVGVMGAYLMLCVGLAFRPRRPSVHQLAALTAALIVGTQLWKNLHSCEYVGWYAPVLLVTLFAVRPAADGEALS